MRKRATKQLFQLACVVAEMAIFVSKVWTTIIMEYQCCNVTAEVDLDINASCCQARRESGYEILSPRCGSSKMMLHFIHLCRLSASKHR